MSNVTRPEPEWVNTARKLREVRQACLQFLDRWAISHLVSDASALDRVAGDIQAQDNKSENRDWSFLYRGSVLDD
jgi:hypothetical protein